MCSWRSSQKTTGSNATVWNSSLTMASRRTATAEPALMVLRNDGGMSQKVGLVPEPRSSMGQQAGSTQRLPIGRAMALLAAQDAVRASDAGADSGPESTRGHEIRSQGAVAVPFAAWANDRSKSSGRIAGRSGGGRGEPRRGQRSQWSSKARERPMRGFVWRRWSWRSLCVRMRRCCSCHQQLEAWQWPRRHRHLKGRAQPWCLPSSPPRL